MNVALRTLRRFLGPLTLAASSTLFAGCVMTVEAVNPTPNVAVSGDGTYSVDVRKVPDIVEPGRGVTITEVRKSLQSGFENAVGQAYRPNLGGGTKLIFESFSASIDDGQIGILRITYRARWVTEDGETLAQAAGTALPKNPIQTGEGHWRDVLEVMYEQLVEAFDKAQQKREKTERQERRDEHASTRRL